MLPFLSTTVSKDIVWSSLFLLPLGLRILSFQPTCEILVVSRPTSTSSRDSPVQCTQQSLHPWSFSNWARERLSVLRDLRGSLLVLFEFASPVKNKNKNQKPAIKTKSRERPFSACTPRCLELGCDKRTPTRSLIGHHHLTRMFTACASHPLAGSVP